MEKFPEERNRKVARPDSAVGDMYKRMPNPAKLFGLGGTWRMTGQSSRR
jgi:hypothetical protein